MQPGNVNHVPISCSCSFSPIASSSSWLILAARSFDVSFGSVVFFLLFLGGGGADVKLDPGESGKSLWLLLYSREVLPLTAGEDRELAFAVSGCEAVAAMPGPDSGRVCGLMTGVCSEVPSYIIATRIPSPSSSQVRTT